MVEAKHSNLIATRTTLVANSAVQQQWVGGVPVRTYSTYIQYCMYVRTYVQYTYVRT